MLRTVVVGVIRFYRRAISPWTPAACRFRPTCSAYALEAVERHGSVKGAALAVRRLLRCHPWGGEGYDPVPEVAPGVDGDGPARDPSGPPGYREGILPEGDGSRVGAGGRPPRGFPGDGRAGEPAEESRTTRATENP